MIGLLREVATIKKVPVICYGLRTDFRSKLFDGSKRLLELADCIEEIKVVASSHSIYSELKFISWYYYFLN